MATLEAKALPSGPREVCVFCGRSQDMIIDLTWTDGDKVLTQPSCFDCGNALGENVAAWFRQRLRERIPQETPTKRRF